jgi:hypothetical protein
MRRLRPGVTFHANKGPIHSDEKLQERYDADSDHVDNFLIQLIQNAVGGKSRPKAREGFTKTPAKWYPEVLKASKESSGSDVIRNDNETSLGPTSSEVFEDILKRLQRLGDRGRTVLRRLNRQMGDILTTDEDQSSQRSLNVLRNIVRDMLEEQKDEAGPGDDKQSDRIRRGITLSPPTLQQALNMHAEDEDAAIEEVSERV